MEEMSNDITVTFKITSGKRFDATLSPQCTVLEAKEKVEAQCDIPAKHQRYIFKGSCKNETFAACYSTRTLMCSRAYIERR